MADRKSVDISDMPDILRLVNEAASLDQPLVLRRGAKVVATVSPVFDDDNGHLTADQIESLRAAAGSWADLDADTFLEQVRSDRDNSDRPIAEL